MFLKVCKDHMYTLRGGNDWYQRGMANLGNTKSQMRSHTSTRVWNIKKENEPGEYEIIDEIPRIHRVWTIQRRLNGTSVGRNKLSTPTTQGHGRAHTMIIRWA